MATHCMMQINITWCAHFKIFLKTLDNSFFQAIPMRGMAVNGHTKMLLRSFLDECSYGLRMRNHHNMGCALDDDGVF